MRVFPFSLGKPEEIPKEELLELAVLGGEAETVKRVMGKALARDRDSIINQFVGLTPDLGQYAFYAGQLSMIQKILRTLDLQSQDGKEAARQLREG